MLNAFRHHRGGHPWPRRTRPGPRVLNAFRHHRGGHIDDRGHARQLRECSTPFGITRGACPVRPTRGGTGSVLNAFRHHRGGHLTNGGALSVSWPCSTPFGITEGGIWSPRISGTRANCAQRLSASQRGAYERVIYGCDRQNMCSTPFGITEGGMRATKDSRARSKCAQRLSASQRGASGTRGMKPRVHPVLNAFRHHRGGHSRRAARPGDRSRVLNAFRHHRGGHPGAATAAGSPPGAQRLSASQRGA